MDINIGGGGDSGGVPAWLTAILPLAGVWLGSAMASRQQRRQLVHDANQRKKDRAGALLKDVVLQAIDAHTRVFDALATAPMNDGAKLDLARIEFGAAMTKMQVSCGSATAKQAHQLPLLLGHAQFELAPYIQAIRDLRASKEQLTISQANHEAAIVQLTNQIGRAAGSTALERMQLIAELDRQRATEAQLVALTKAEIASTDKKIGELVGQFFRKLFDVIDPIHEVTFAMLNNIRGELDVSAMDDQSLEDMRKSTQAMRARILDLVEKTSPPQEEANHG